MSGVIITCFFTQDHIFCKENRRLEASIRVKSFFGFLNFQDGHLSVDHFVSFKLASGPLPWTPTCHNMVLGRVYQFVAMPLGLANAPWGFTNLVKKIEQVG